MGPAIATSEVGKPQGGTEAKVKGTPALFKKIFQDLTASSWNQLQLCELLLSIKN